MMPCRQDVELWQWHWPQSVGHKGMTHPHAWAAQLDLLYSNRRRQEEAPTGKGRCCSSSQKGRVFLGWNFIVSLITSLGTRFFGFRWDPQQMAMISLASLCFWLGHRHTSLTCSARRVNKSNHSTPTTLYQSGWRGDLWISLHLQRCRETSPATARVSVAIF